VLSWLSATPALIGMCVGAVTTVFTPASARLKLLFAWMLLCALALSPVRYMLFQIVAATAYPWQGLRAFLSTLVLAIYIPIVWGLLADVAIALPVFLATLILGKTETPACARVFACAAIFPLLCVKGSLSESIRPALPAPLQPSV
jgi:hypothetical protein